MELKTLGGFKRGELSIMAAGSGAGKSNFWTIRAIQRLMEDLNNRPIEDLIVSKSTYLGARFYTVAPVGGNWLEMETWCTNTFGDRTEVWDIKTSAEQQLARSGRWLCNDRRFWFRAEKDRDWFILRWSSA